jgi:hypothetical protein
MNTTAFFDATNVDTPAGLTTAVGMGSISGIPSSGTGLMGAAFVPGTSIWNTAKAAEAAAGTPDATFVASEVMYASRQSETTVAEFIGNDAASLQGNGNLEMGPSALTLSGFIYIPPGVHEAPTEPHASQTLKVGCTRLTCCISMVAAVWLFLSRSTVCL